MIRGVPVGRLPGSWKKTVSFAFVAGKTSPWMSRSAGWPHIPPKMCPGSLRAVSGRLSLGIRLPLGWEEVIFLELL